MKIGLISKLWETTDPTSTGGTGAIVGILAEELMRRGHEVTVFGTGDSKTNARLITLRDTPWKGEDYSEPIEYLHIAEAFSKRYFFDVIQCNVEQKACYFAAQSKTPTLVSIQYGEFFDDELTVLKQYADLPYIAPSKALMTEFSFLSWKGFIYHGINPDDFMFNETPGDYLLFLGRLSPQKGPDVAIRVALATGKKLILAGKTSPGDKAYLDKHVMPLIDGEQIQYVGVADFKTKLQLLKNAIALLHPISFVEAFGMTLIEAMACGTPVIAFNRGAISEVVENKRTGFVVSNEEEMKESIQHIPGLTRRDCRDRVEKHFTSKRMAEQYEALYKTMVQDIQNNVT